MGVDAMHCQDFMKLRVHYTPIQLNWQVFPQTAKCTTDVGTPVYASIFPMCMYRRMRMYGYAC